MVTVILSGCCCHSRDDLHRRRRRRKLRRSHKLASQCRRKSIKTPLILGTLLLVTLQLCGLVTCLEERTKESSSSILALSMKKRSLQHLQESSNRTNVLRSSVYKLNKKDGSLTIRDEDYTRTSITNIDSGTESDDNSNKGTTTSNSNTETTTNAIALGSHNNSKEIINNGSDQNESTSKVEGTQLKTEEEDFTAVQHHRIPLPDFEIAVQFFTNIDYQESNVNNADGQDAAATDCETLRRVLRQYLLCYFTTLSKTVLVENGVDESVAQEWIISNITLTAKETVKKNASGRYLRRSLPSSTTRDLANKAFNIKQAFEGFVYITNDVTNSNYSPQTSVAAWFSEIFYPQYVSGLTSLPNAEFTNIMKEHYHGNIVGDIWTRAEVTSMNEAIYGSSLTKSKSGGNNSTNVGAIEEEEIQVINDDDDDFSTQIEKDRSDSHNNHDMIAQEREQAPPQVDYLQENDETSPAITLDPEQAPEYIQEQLPQQPKQKEESLTHQETYNEIQELLLDKPISPPTSTLEKSIDRFFEDNPENNADDDPAVYTNQIPKNLNEEKSNQEFPNKKGLNNAEVIAIITMVASIVVLMLSVLIGVATTCPNKLPLASRYYDGVEGELEDEKNGSHCNESSDRNPTGGDVICGTVQDSKRETASTTFRRLTSPNSVVLDFETIPLDNDKHIDDRHDENDIIERYKVETDHRKGLYPHHRKHGTSLSPSDMSDRLWGFRKSLHPDETDINNKSYSNPEERQLSPYEDEIEKGLGLTPLEGVDHPRHAKRDLSNNIGASADVSKVSAMSSWISSQWKVLKAINNHNQYSPAASSLQNEVSKDIDMYGTTASDSIQKSFALRTEQEDNKPRPTFDNLLERMTQSCGSPTQSRQVKQTNIITILPPLSTSPTSAKMASESSPTELSERTAAARSRLAAIRANKSPKAVESIRLTSLSVGENGANRKNLNLRLVIPPPPPPLPTLSPLSCVPPSHNSSNHNSSLVNRLVTPSLATTSISAARTSPQKLVAIPTKLGNTRINKRRPKKKTPPLPNKQKRGKALVVSMDSIVEDLEEEEEEEEDENKAHELLVSCKQWDFVCDADAATGPATSNGGTFCNNDFSTVQDTDNSQQTQTLDSETYESYYDKCLPRPKQITPDASDLLFLDTIDKLLHGCNSGTKQENNNKSPDISSYTSPLSFTATAHNDTIHKSPSTIPKSISPINLPLNRMKEIETSSTAPENDEVPSTACSSLQSEASTSAVYSRKSHPPKKHRSNPLPRQEPPSLSANTNSVITTNSTESLTNRLRSLTPKSLRRSMSATSTPTKEYQKRVENSRESQLLLLVTPDSVHKTDDSISSSSGSMGKIKNALSSSSSPSSTRSLTSSLRKRRQQKSNNAAKSSTRNKSRKNVARSLSPAATRISFDYDDGQSFEESRHTSKKDANEIPSFAPQQDGIVVTELQRTFSDTPPPPLSYDHDDGEDESSVNSQYSYTSSTSIDSVVKADVDRFVDKLEGILRKRKLLFSRGHNHHERYEESLRLQADNELRSKDAVNDDTRHVDGTTLVDDAAAVSRTNDESLQVGYFV